MQKLNNLLVLSLLSLFLASCATGFKVIDRATSNMLGDADENLIAYEPNKIFQTEPSRLVDSEEFITQQVARIEKDVALGPKLFIDPEKADEIKKNERRLWDLRLFAI